ncbi:MAG: endonuclease/exonuclease/phosphatase family protein, partial [Thalassotalea sp.]|nr:endonuclease/exonuclease/phosphatase family protein [Thalassotalea sp.]
MNALAKNTKSDNQIRVATFNVSMEALNYAKRTNGKSSKVTGDELNNALKSDHQQIKNIAEIIQRVNPDILLLNEFDYSPKGEEIQLFINQYLNKDQQNQAKIHFPYYYQSSVNTGVKTPFDLNNDNKIESPTDTYGFGHFPGHFGMVLLSKYPIDEAKIRTFQTFKWKDMPDALQPKDPSTGKSWYSDEAWQGFRLSSKSHWDVPVTVNNKEIHILASHPTPPVFDGPEDRNGKRNHDEIRFWHDYISSNKNAYIYDDKKQFGG